MTQLNPFRKNDVVRVKKGSVIRFKGADRVAKKDYEVTVNWTMDPYRILIGRYVHYEHGSKFHFNGCTDNDLYTACERLGLPYDFKDSDESPSLVALRELAMQDMVDHYGHGTCWDCYVTLAPAKVVWPGSGGYWMETGIENVEKVEG